MQNHEHNIWQVFQPLLIRDERILWTGQPEPSVNFTSADLFFVPFSLLWFGFIIFWESMVLFISPAPAGINIPFALFGIPFLLIGLYITFGRFIYKRWKKRRTFYAVTSKRIMIITRTSVQRSQIRDIYALSDIDVRVRSDGIGTLSFPASDSRPSIGIFREGYRFSPNTGMDIIPSFVRTSCAFFDIKDVDKVYKLVMERKAAES